MKILKTLAIVALLFISNLSFGQIGFVQFNQRNSIFEPEYNLLNPFGFDLSALCDTVYYNWDEQTRSSIKGGESIIKINDSAGIKYISVNHKAQNYTKPLYAIDYNANQSINTLIDYNFRYNRFTSFKFYYASDGKIDSVRVRRTTSGWNDGTYHFIYKNNVIDKINHMDTLNNEITAYKYTYKNDDIEVEYNSPYVAYGSSEKFKVINGQVVKRYSKSNSDWDMNYIYDLNGDLDSIVFTDRRFFYNFDYKFNGLTSVFHNVEGLGSILQYEINCRTSKYSGVEKVKNEFGIYPNPIDKNVLNCNVLKDAKYFIYDLFGKLIQDGNLVSGKNIIELNTQFEKGIYLFRINDKTEKIAIQ